MQFATFHDLEDQVFLSLEGSGIGADLTKGFYRRVLK